MEFEHNKGAVKSRDGISSDEKEKITESREINISQQSKPKAPKPKKRKKPKDSTAPRQPLSGYLRFSNERRDAVREENPTVPFSEITKILASEWSNLAVDKKQQYLDAADQDKERYIRECNVYKQTEAYKQFAQQQKEKKQKKDDSTETEVKIATTTTAVQPVPYKDPQFNCENNFDVPIFTEQFLDHNKSRDAELRELRKSNNEYEEQNATLQKHIESMKGAIEKLETEILQQKKTNTSLQQQLEHLRITLTNGFANVKLPGVNETATLQNIDNYMTNLHSILLENSNNDINLLQIVRNIVSKLEFNG